MTPQQRYTGPELSALLREVRAELGDQATIHEANRIRTGGIGGFFRKEGFEVLASPPPSSILTQGMPGGLGGGRQPAGRGRMGTATAGHLALSDTLDADDELIAALTAAMESEQAWVDAIGAASSPPPPVVERRPVRRFGPEDLAPIVDDDDRIGPATMRTATISPRADAALWTEVPSPAAAMPRAESVSRTEGVRGRSAQETPVGPRVMTPGQALLERADDISADERVGQLLNGARDLIDDATILDRSRPLDQTFAERGRRAVPPRGLMGDPNAAARLPGLLHRVEPGELQAAPPAITSTAFVEPGETPAPHAVTAPRETVAHGQSTTPDKSHSPSHLRPETTLRPSSAEIAPRAIERPDEIGETAFWHELTRLERILPVRPSSQASVQLLVGPLDIALPLAIRFAADSSIELSVFTDEVELEGFRRDQLAESSRELHRRLHERAHTGGRCIGVIETDDDRGTRGGSLDRLLTPRVLTMIERVCDDSAVHLIRLTLRSLGPIDEMCRIVESFPIPCAIDLGDAPSGAELEAALDAQLPIVSIAGRQLTPALAMALKHR